MMSSSTAVKLTHYRVWSRASIIKGGMSRYRTLLSLGVVVLLVGLASLVATGAIGREPPLPRATATASAPTTPAPPSCKANQLALAGVFNDCAVSVATTSSCAAGSLVFNAVIRFHGTGHDYLLYLHIGNGYHGSGTYANSTVSVDLREYATGAFWQSIPGVVLRVSGSDGRSGAVKAALAYVGGEPTPPTVGLNISGAWRCT
jgi:hypothetical protein